MATVIQFEGFNADAVRAHLGVTQDDALLSAAIQSHYNYMSGEPRLNPHDRIDNNKGAVDLCILNLQFIVPAILRFTDSFFDGADLDKDASIVAAICGDCLNHERDDYDPRFFRNLDLIDPSLEDRAAAIQAEASRYNDKGLWPGESVSMEAAFVAHVEAIGIARAMINDYKRKRVGSDDISATLNELQTSAGYVQINKSLGFELFTAVLELKDAYNKSLPTAKIHHFPPKPAP